MNCMRNIFSTLLLAASLALMMLSLAMVLMVTVGAALSTLYSCVAVALLPLTLVTRTWALASPSRRAAISAAGYRS